MAKQIEREHAPGNTLVKREYARFTAAQRRMQRLVLLAQTLLLLAFLGVWELAGRRFWIDVLLFSYPSKIAALLAEKMADGSIWIHIGVTFWETLVGFVLGTVVGTLIAIVIWWSPFLYRTLDPYIVVANSMPKVALGPLFIVGLGPGLLAIIATTLSITVIVTTLVVYSSFREVDPNFVKVVRVFGGSKRDVFRKVILPASFPTIVSTLKVNVGLAWVGVIVGEFLVSKQGLGYLIIYGFQVFNFTLVLASIAVIAVLATLMYKGVAVLEERLTRRK